MRAAVESGFIPGGGDYKFERTVVWNGLVNSAGFLHPSGESLGELSTEELLAELWADPDLCLQAYQYAALRYLVRQAAQLSGTKLSPDKIAAVEEAFRADRGVGEQADFEGWLDRHRITPAQFGELIEDEALQHESSLAPSPFPHRWMIDWLRISGRFEAMASAALAKKNDAPDAEPLDPHDPEARAEALLQWYVEQLASPDAAGNVASRVMLPYLRKDWEAFLLSIVKQHRVARGAPSAAGENVCE
jgi:hypothetical protein